MGRVLSGRDDGKRVIPNVGVGAIIVRDRKFLLMKRRSAMGNQSWSTPGGYLEFGESFSACAQREAEEEVGYAGEPFSFLGLTNDLFEARHFVTVWMISSAPPGWIVPSISEEVAETGWFALGDLPQPLFSPFSNLVAGASEPEGALLDYFSR